NTRPNKTIQNRILPALTDKPKGKTRKDILITTSQTRKFTHQGEHPSTNSNTSQAKIKTQLRYKDPTPSSTQEQCRPDHQIRPHPIRTKKELARFNFIVNASIAC